MDAKKPAVDRRSWLVLAGLGLIWGSTWIAADALAEHLPPLLAAAARFLLSAVLLTPFLFSRRAKFPSGRVLAMMLMLAVSMIVLPLVLLVWARPQLPSATVVVLFAATPLVVILLTPGLNGHDVPPRALQASVAGLGGLVLAMGATFSGAQAGAAAVVFCAVASSAISSLMARRLLVNQDAVAIGACLLAAAGLLLIIASLLLERGEAVQWDRRAFASLILLAVIGTAPAYIAWLWLLQRLPAYQAVTVQWIEPLVALAESALLLHIGFSLSMIAGSAITLVSLYAILRTRAEDDQSVSLLGN